MKIEMTIGKNYVDWSLWEAIRELMQNGLDAKKDGHEFSVTYVEKDKMVRLVTKGATLEPRTLLVGYTSKRGRTDQLGRFGEGYKLALLALVNSGHRTVIRTGADKWVPEVAPSEKFGGEMVLVIDVQKGVVKERNAIEIEVADVEPADWESLQRKLLFLLAATDTVATSKGAVIFDESKRGHIYVGGIFVQQVGNYVCGYDLPPNVAKIDRDRRLIDGWDLSNVTATIWNEAVDLRPDLIEMVDRLMRENKPDVEHLRYTWNTGNKLREKMAARFRETFGENAIPVRQPQEMEEAAFYGKRGIVVPEAMLEVLKEETGTINTVKSDSKNLISATFGVSDLTTEESDVFLKAFALASLGAPDVPLSRFRIAEFKDPSLHGLRENEHILVGRQMLKTVKDTLETLVHEMAHERSKSGDATIEHQKVIEEMWSTIVMSLVERGTTPPAARLSDILN